MLRARKKKSLSHGGEIVRQEQTVSGELGDGLDAARLLIRHAEAVGQKVGQRHLFLADEATLRQLAVRNRSTAAQMPAAVVIWMAETASVCRWRAGRRSCANTSCT
jgi:hypothetical protein